MSCEERMTELGALMDGETEGAPTGLFAHLETCAGCRAFLDGLLRVRGAVRRDRDRALAEADALLPAAAPLPARAARDAEPVPAADASGSRAGRAWFGWPAFLPAPAAVALAALLLVAGILIGAGLSVTVRRPTRPSPEVEMAKQPPGGPTVVYVCSLPEVEVVAAPLPKTEN